jgi:hypothetical protein
VLRCLLRFVPCGSIIESRNILRLPNATTLGAMRHAAFLSRQVSAFHPFAPQQRQRVWYPPKDRRQKYLGMLCSGCQPSNQKARCDHATPHRPPNQRPLLNEQASAAGATPPRRTSNRASASSMATKNSSRSSDATTPVRAIPGGVLKNCCMPSGRYDGALRDDYFRE